VYIRGPEVNLDTQEIVSIEHETITALNPPRLVTLFDRKPILEVTSILPILRHESLCDLSS